jgi:hypothetical protein
MEGRLIDLILDFVLDNFVNCLQSMTIDDQKANRSSLVSIWSLRSLQSLWSIVHFHMITSLFERIWCERAGVIMFAGVVTIAEIETVLSQRSRSLWSLRSLQSPPHWFPYNHYDRCKIFFSNHNEWSDHNVRSYGNQALVLTDDQLIVTKFSLFGNLWYDYHLITSNQSDVFNVPNQPIRCVLRLW